MPDNEERPSSMENNVTVNVTPAQRSHSRWIEDIGFFVGILQALFYGALEALRSAGFKLGDCPTDHPFPWVTIIIFLGCVAPKTLGRATTGRIWQAIGDKLGAK